MDSRKPKVYIAGPMRGIKTYNFPQFFYWQVVLEQMGCEVINPAEEDCRRWFEEGWLYSDDQWESILEHDKKLVEQCDIIFLLDGWEKSEGARAEQAHAEANNIPPVVQADVDKICERSEKICATCLWGRNYQEGEDEMTCLKYLDYTTPDDTCPLWA